MIACSYCGSLTDETATICATCGNILAGAAPSAAPYCLVCGLMLPPTRAHKVGVVCPRCKVPLGDVMDPNDVTCSTVLPFAYRAVPIGAANPLQPAIEPIVSRRASWNWGAAICSTFWAFRHRRRLLGSACLVNLLFWTIVALGIPLDGGGAQADPNSVSADSTAAAVVLLLMMCSAGFWFCKTIYLGLCGNWLAIQYGHYKDDSSMRESRRKWNVRGGTIGGLFLVLLFCEIIWGLLR